MKYLLMTSFSIVMLFSVCFAGEKVELKDENDKVSYSVGYQVGGDFKRQGVELNPEILVKGIQDAITESEPILSQKEMRTILVDLKKSITAAQQKERKEKAQKNLADGKAFLSENGKKEGVKILSSGLQYRVIKEGTGVKPKATDTVTVHYRGTLINGTEFDSSYKRGEPATFRADRVIPGWKEALQLMKEGAKWQLFIPSDLAYGERGGGPIEPNSTLIFDVELISIQRAK